MFHLFLYSFQLFVVIKEKHLFCMVPASLAQAPGFGGKQEWQGSHMSGLETCSLLSVMSVRGLILT